MLTLLAILLLVVCVILLAAPTNAPKNWAVVGLACLAALLVVLGAAKIWP